MLAVDVDLARIRLVGPGEDLDQRRLAGTVMAEQPDYFPGAKIDGDAVHGLDAPEGDGDVAHLDERRRSIRVHDALILT
jgi:hypothetical protein